MGDRILRQIILTSKYINKKIKKKEQDRIMVEREGMEEQPCLSTIHEKDMYFAMLETKQLTESTLKIQLYH